MELKQSVVNGMKWTFIEKIATNLFQMLAGLVLMNFLAREVYGTLAVLVVFTSICSVFVDSGFSSALIRRKEVGPSEYSSVFFFNILVAVVLYGILVAVTPAIAVYYNEPIIRSIAPVLFLLVPVNAFSNIQNIILTRDLEFKTISKYTMWATVGGSCVSVVMAVCGMGIWSLLGQRLLTPVIKSAMLWIGNRWRPSGRPSFAPLRSMTGYSSRLLLSDIANTIYSNISGLFIGRMYKMDALGSYDRGKQYKDIPVSTVISSVQNVTFPALARLHDNPAKMSLTARQVTVVMNFLIFPVMVGMIAVAEDFISVFLPERWLSVVPYFQILSISGLFAPLSVVSYNILKIKSDGKMIFRLEIVKKLIATAVLVATIPISVKAIAWGQTVIFLSDAIINMFGAGRYVKWGFWTHIKDTIPYLVFSAAMLAAVYGTHILLVGYVPLFAVLCLEVVAGALVYGLLTIIFKPQGWREIKIILRQYFDKRRQA